MNNYKASTWISIMLFVIVLIAAPTTESQGVEIKSNDPNTPALRVVGAEGNDGIGLELVKTGNQNGIIASDQSNSTSGLFVYSNDNIQLYIDRDDNEQGVWAVIGTPGNCQIADGGNFSCSGTKSASVEIENERRLMYALESPEVWFEDFGSGNLQNGQVVITIDPQYASVINLDKYHVFLTPLGDCQGLFVTNKTQSGFEVRELGGGNSNISFDYRITAHRRGYEEDRLEIDTAWKAMKKEESKSQ